MNKSSLILLLMLSCVSKTDRSAFSDSPVINALRSPASTNVCVNFWEKACSNPLNMKKRNILTGKLGNSPFEFGGIAHLKYIKIFSHWAQTHPLFPEYSKYKEALAEPSFSINLWESLSKFEALYQEIGSTAAIDRIQIALSRTHRNSIKPGHSMGLYPWDSESGWVHYKVIENDLRPKDSDPEKLRLHNITRNFRKEETKLSIKNAPEIEFGVSLLRHFCQAYPGKECFKEFRQFVIHWHEGYFRELHIELGKNKEFRNEVLAAVFPAQRRQQLQAMLKEIYEIAIELNRARLSEADVKKLREVKLEFPEVLEGMPFQALAYGSNGYYLGAGTQSIVLLGGYSSQSDNNLLRVLAHEFGHYFDFEIPSQKKWSQQKKICLADPVSAGISEIQGAEAFADWFAAEILSVYFERKLKLSPKSRAIEKVIDLVSETVVTTCLPLSNFTGNTMVLGDTGPVHPAPNQRVEKIYLAHPFFRQILGCLDDVKESQYCRPD